MAKGYGYTIAYGASGQTTAHTSTLGKGRDLSFPSMSVDVIDLSSNDSAGQFVEKAPGFKDPGKISLQFLFNKTEYGEMLGLVGEQKSWKITFSGGSTMIFEGWLSLTGGQVEYRGAMIVDAEIEIAQQVIYTE